MTDRGIRILFPACALVAALAASPLVAAGPAPYRAKLFAAAAYVAPLAETDQNFGGILESAKAQEKLGYEVGMAGRWNSLIGFEVSYLNATHEVDLGGRRIGEIDFEPIAFTLEFHLAGGAPVDPWIGPTVAWVRWSDLRIDADDDVPVSSSAEHAYGATLGLDVVLGRHLALTAALRYLNANAKLEGYRDLAVDPLFARLGVAVRW